MHNDANPFDKPFSPQEEGLRVLMVKRYHSTWWPARRYWNALQLWDPFADGDSLCRTQRLHGHLRDLIDGVRTTPPETIVELAEKLKVAASLGAHRWLEKSKSPDAAALFETLAQLSPVRFFWAWRQGPADCSDVLDPLTTPPLAATEDARLIFFIRNALVTAFQIPGWRDAVIGDYQRL